MYINIREDKEVVLIMNLEKKVLHIKNQVMQS